jgi:hypothetical protein
MSEDKDSCPRCNGERTLGDCQVTQLLIETYEVHQKHCQLCGDGKVCATGEALKGDAFPQNDSAQLITVCDQCLQASCWQGVFYCDDAKTAGTVQKTRAELAKLGREHSDYWKTNDQL